MTIGIIGIVAAMTIPSVIRHYKSSVLQAQFKKAYTDLNAASKMFEVHNDMTVSEYSSGNSVQAFSLFSKEFSAVVRKDNSRYDNNIKDDVTYGARAYRDSKGTPRGWSTLKNRKTDQAGICDSSGFFFDGQGRAISFDDKPLHGYNGPKVCIDINGQKGPNIYGVDYFVFMFTTDGYVIPYMEKHKNNPTYCTDVNTNCVPNDEP